MMHYLFEQERYFKLQVTKLLSQKKNHQCLYGDCQKQAISSHSLSRSALTLIANNKHVIAPVFDRNDIGNNCEEYLKNNEINLRFKPVGINIASTFKGFCSDDDNSIFSNIDNHGIVSQRDILLQLYRIASKYFFINQISSHAEVEARGYEYYCNTEFEEKIPLGLNKIITLLEDFSSGCPELDDPISLPFSKYLTMNPFSPKIDLDIQILYKKSPILYPVALHKDFVIKRANMFHRCLICILPGNDKTDIMVLCEPELFSLFGSFICNGEIKLLNWIESILMSDSEFFVNPKIIENWSDQKKKMIEEDYYFFSERKFLEEYEISIFDDIRRSICDSLPDIQRNHEIGKIEKLPSRKSFQERDNLLTYRNIRDRHWKIKFTGNEYQRSYSIGSLIVEE